MTKVYILECGLCFDGPTFLGVFAEGKKDFALAHPIFKYEQNMKRHELSNGGVYLEGEEIWISLRVANLNEYEKRPFVSKQIEEYIKENL